MPEGAECSPSIRIAFRRVEPCPPHWRQLTQPEPAPLPVASTPAQRLLRRVSAQDRGGRQRPRRFGACQVSRAKSDVCAQNIRYAGGRGAERPDLEPHVTSINNMRAKSRVVSGRCETWQPCPGPASRRWKSCGISLSLAGTPLGPSLIQVMPIVAGTGLPGNPVSATTRHPDQAPPVGVRLTPMTHHRPRPQAISCKPLSSA